MIKTQVLKVGREGLAENQRDACSAVLKSGGLIVFPTDTVYGVGCNAFHPDGLRRIYALKGRHYSKALPILLSHRHQLELVAKEIPKEAGLLMDAFWPGALTLVFKTAAIALHATRGKSTVAVRVPDHGVIRELLELGGVPLASTSANMSGKPSLKTGASAVKLFEGKVELILDGGRCKVGRESSVVDASHYPFSILREGALSKNLLAQRLNLA